MCAVTCTTKEEVAIGFYNCFYNCFYEKMFHEFGSEWLHDSSEVYPQITRFTCKSCANSFRLRHMDRKTLADRDRVYRSFKE
jgi:hypothetical protein